MAVQIEKSVSAVALYLATLRVGGVFLPLNTSYTPFEIEYFLRDAEPTVFVCEPARKLELEVIASGAGATCLTLDTAGRGSFAAAVEGRKSAFVTVPRAQNDLAALLYTSGTTGRSKGAMLSHGGLISNSTALRDAWEFSESDVLIHALPMFHTHGLFVAINLSFLSRASLILLPKFDIDLIFNAMPRASCFMGVPTFYVRLLEDERLTPDAVDHMRLFISGSAPLLAETHHRWEERTRHVILERYGMTETNMNTSNPYKEERRAGTVGRPLPGIEVRITGMVDGVPLSFDEVGMIEVRGPNLFLGYWRMAEKTKEEMRENGFFVTGDIGKFDGDGYLHILGRSKDLIITGGYNVYPAEIEAEVNSIPGVIESAVIGLAHPDFGEGVAALVVSRTALAEAEMLNLLKSRLAKYKLPKRIIFVDELPRNSMGKVQKNILRNTFSYIFA